jgi:hypothetical protein
MARGNYERCPDRLLTKELVHDPVLHPLHERLTKESDNSGVDPGCHQAERVAGRDEAVVGLQFLESGPDDSNVLKPIETEAEGIAHGLVGMG